MTRYSTLLATICLSLLLQACVPTFSVNVKDKINQINLPQAFSKKQNKNTINKDKSQSSATQNWQYFFNDIKLQNLIETALGNNQKLRIIEQEIAINRNEVSGLRGEYLPKVNAGASYDRERSGEFTSQGVSDEHNELPKQLNNREIGFYSSWEIDIWKRLRNAKKSAYLRYLASIQGQRFMVTHLVSEIASDYYELLSLDKQLVIVKKYIDTLEKGLKIVQYQKEAAIANSLAVKRFEAEVLKNKSRLYAIKQRITVIQNHLNTLVGGFPKPILRNANMFLDITLPKLDAGLPTELIENRPDIKQAMLNMKASELDVKIAKARFYPALSLDANLGLQSFKTNFLNTPESLFYVIGTNLTAPIFNRLAIEADFKSANNKQLQTIYAYQKTLVNAYSEVVNQLAIIKNTKEIYHLKTQQVIALKESIDVADILFKAARIDYLESLLTQRDALKAQMEQIKVKQKQLTAYVNLYKSLGGGWRFIPKPKNNNQSMEKIVSK